MTQTRWTTLAALLLAALLLTGCGGGGGGDSEPTVTQTVHDELQAELDAALANLTKEREAKAAAEEARAAADTARMAADEARQAAETERDTAQQARTDAEAARAAAQDAQAMAETARQAAADAQAAAEGERDTAEASEAAANAAEALALAAEMAAKAAQATAEAERDTAQAAQAAAEADKAEALASKAEAEAAELTAKAVQTAAEAARDKALADKTAVEADRDTKRDAARDAEIELIEVKAARDAALAQVTRLTGELETVKANVTRLTGELSDANADVTELTGFLNTAQGEVTRLKGEIGVETDAADADGSLHAQLNAANAEVASLTARVGTTSDASSLTGRLETANAEVTRLTGLLNTANAEVTRLTGVVGTATDADSLTGKLEAEKLKVSRLQNQVSIHEDTIAGLRDQLADARADVTDAEQRAEQAKREADRKIAEAERQAETQANVIVRAPLLITTLGGLEASDAATAAQASVTHMPGESRTFIRPSSLPPKGSAPSVLGGWSSASFSGPRGTVGTDTVYLYTNIEAPSSKAFWKVYGESVDSSTTDDFTAKAKPSSFGTPGTSRMLHTSDRATLTRGGTYDGYSGTFSCRSANAASPACNISAAATDALTFDGPWKFTATLTREISRREQDTEFLYFGIWAFDPTNPADDTNEHDFKFVFGGDATDDIENFGMLTGTATFAGGAIGKYALAKVGGRAAKIGTFTATAAFSAIFNAEDSTISGRITDFKDGGSSLGSNWHVFLGVSASAPVALVATGVTAGLAAGSIDGDSATGTWGATLHGSDNYNQFTDRDKYPLSRYPVADVAGVAGWFEATADTNAAIAGAFGAVCTLHPACVR